MGLAARAGVGAVVTKQVPRRGQGPGQGRGRAGKVRTLLNGKPQAFQSRTALSPLEVSSTLMAVEVGIRAIPHGLPSWNWKSEDVGSRWRGAGQ